VAVPPYVRNGWKSGHPLESLYKFLTTSSGMTGICKTARALSVSLVVFATPGPGVTAVPLPEAPLPSGVSPSNDEKVPGLYAESSYGLIAVIAEVERLEEDCAARGTPARIDGRELLWKGQRRLYRSRSTIADHDERPTVTSDKASCKARVTLVRSFKVMPATGENLERAGWSGERPSCGYRNRKCREGIFAQVKARCVDLGDGLVGSTTCYSIQDDLSRDLQLGGSNYTDDGSGPDNSWGFDLVLPNALIDPAVFRDAAGLPK